MANLTLSPEVRDVLARSTITATLVILPHGQLPRPLYEAVNKVLVNAGGKWNRFAGGHIFKHDPRAKLGLTLESGVSVDEQKKFQAFHTPPELAAQVVTLAEVSGHVVLEPSAGQGALVKECLALGAKAVDCIEINHECWDILTAAQAGKVTIDDFLACDPVEKSIDRINCRYARIVMNPPFTRDQDILHVAHALKWLAPGGILVAIMLDNIGRPKFQALTGRLDEQDVPYSFVKVPANTFKDTPVRTIILKVRLPATKPVAEVPAPKPTPVQPPKTNETKTTVASPGGRDAVTMKLNIKRTRLVEALAAVKPAANGSAATPILANVLLVANEKSITLTASDLDLNLRVKTDAAVSEPGRTTVRASLLHEIARSTTGETIALKLVKDTLHVESGTAKFQLATMDADKFPPLPRVNGGRDAVTEFSVGESALHAMFARTVFATSADADRLVFNSSLLSLNGKLSIAACDGRRLGLITAESLVKSKLDLIIPAKTVRELMRLLDPAKEERKVQVIAGKNLVQFNFGDTSIVSKLIEGDYPDYQQIIPATETAVASIPRVDLLAAVELVALVADGVRLDFRTHSLVIASTRVAGDKKDLIGDATDSLLCASARELSIKLNAAFLRDALRATRSEVVEFHANDTGKIAMLKSPDENWLAVIAAMADEKPATAAPKK